MNRSRIRRTAAPAADASDGVHSGLLSAVEKHADNPSAFLALNEGNQYFRDRGGDGFVVYRRSGHHLVQFGGVFAAPEQRASLLRSFRSFAREQRCTIVGIQLQREDLGLFHEEGFTINQVGSSYSLDLTGFSLRGSKFVKLRNKISRARRSGLTVAETDWETCARSIERIDKAWLRSKGLHVKEIEFLVGQLGGPAQQHRRLFVGTLDSGPVSYISYSPAHGSPTGLAARPQQAAAGRPAGGDGGGQPARDGDLHQGGRRLAALRLHPVHRPRPGARSRPGRAG